MLTFRERGTFRFETGTRHRAAAAACVAVAS